MGLMKCLMGSGVKIVGEPNVHQVLYGTGSSYTHTFSDDMSYVYISFARNTDAGWGSYTGNGTVTQQTADSVTNNAIVKIENVKSGDIFVTPDFSLSGNHRYIISIVGEKVS